MVRERKTLRQSIEVEKTAQPVAPEAVGLSQQVEKIKTRTKGYIMDLRIHSPASLGYLGIEGIDTAPALVKLARIKRLDVIAVTDYYSGSYIDRVKEAAIDSNLTVLPGVVIRCQLGACDDVVLSCIFPESCGSAEVAEFLKSLGVPESAAGDRKYLVKRSFEEVLKAVEDRQGAVLPSRMDKTPHRMSVLSLLVEKYGFRAFDLAYADSVKLFKQRWPKIKFHLFSFSNANALAQIGSRIARVKMQGPGFLGVREIIGRQDAGKAGC